MAKFMILMTENDDAWAKISPEEQQRLLTRYFAWVDQLKKDKLLVGGEALGRGGRTLRAEAGRVVDGPYAETKEVITGFFLIEAKDLDAATEIARGCPALTHGESVVVRPVGHV